MTPGRTLLALLALGLAAGCQKDPMEQKVPASTPSAFSHWRGRVATHESPEHRKQVEAAVQEIRMHVAAERRGAGQSAAGEATEEALLKAVDQRPVREMLQYGYELRVQRLKRELSALEEAMRGNADLVTKPGDWQSKQHLEVLRDRNAGRLEKYQADLAAAQAVLAPLMQASGKSLLPPSAKQAEERFRPPSGR